jgi:hypothetical protein
VRSPSNPSAAQQEAALRGTALEGHAAQTVTPWRFSRLVQELRPDVVLLGCTGPTADVIQRSLARQAHRPVLVAGIPGIALPARPKAWTRRSGVDLFVTHSRREAEEYTGARDEVHATGLVGLATLPHLGTAVRRIAAARAAEASAPGGPPERRDVVFATQAKVPKERQDREAVLLALAGLAQKRPDLHVVVKTRGTTGEFHTHFEALHYEDVWAGLVSRGAIGRDAAQGVSFAAGPMPEHLARAAGFVTVSSTAALEAMAVEVPLLLLDDFGVGPELINEAFVGSGVLAGLDALREGRFAQPDPAWKAANYFHPPSENTWLEQLDTLVHQARAGDLPSIAVRIASVGSRLGRARRPWRDGAERLRLTGVGAAVSRLRAQRRAQ